MRSWFERVIAVQSRYVIRTFDEFKASSRGDSSNKNAVSPNASSPASAVCDEIKKPLSISHAENLADSAFLK